MDFSKLKNRLLIVLCVFVILFPFWCVSGLCIEGEEILQPSTVSGISIASNRNYFASASSSVAYVELEVGYKYIFRNVSDFNRNLAVSNEIPVLNGVYTFVQQVSPGDTYEYVAYTNDYLYIDWSAASGEISRVRVNGMDEAIAGLIDNVGTNNFWSIFEVSINYIWVVVLVAFGIFIIFKLIRKLSKGKEGL